MKTDDDMIPSCPFVSDYPTAGLKGYARRWDLAQEAGQLRPLSHLEAPDLTQAGREAWRNSSRCIGRRIWNSLKVVDARSLDSAEEVFEALLSHLRLATNGGRIRSTMSIFSAWCGEGWGVRIWNHQLIRYAGYAMAGGKTLGDPMNTELTRIAMGLGWKPPTVPGAFDLLPLIIEAGGKLRWFALPREEVLEVRIRHPEHPFLEKMGVKWYAVPAVSDMILATGHEVFPCAPFNGYYMGTEIGARDLADEQRYNLLPEIAEGLRLETGRSGMLWKDRALLVLNEAVLHSFGQDGVTITDHHAAGADFMEFCTKEQTSGRNVSADWSWIVPPMSGAATPVFHQKFQLAPVFPNFLHSREAWKTAAGQRLMAAAGRRDKVRRC
jgi:nitric-oxide synthase